MPDASTLVVVALASLALVVVPGPAVIYIVTRSISQGRAAGLASSIGVNLGSAVHVLGASVGLSVVLTRSAALFTVVKWAGVAYLAWIGIRTLMASDETFIPESTDSGELRRILGQGIVVNVLNPKVAMFFVAFLPQFVDTSAPNAGLHFLVLGMVLVTIGLISDSVYALAAGTIGGRFRTNPRTATATRRLAGATYIALAGLAAVAGARST